ncbi:hypothetical protein [Bizionia sp.]|uniref:hypothetical protein n=1 Tax=Bizionia sp. TaxID=1954480 RepID=UPI003A9468A0
MKKVITILILTLIQFSSFSQTKNWNTSAGTNPRNLNFKNGVFNNNMEYFAMAKVSDKNSTDYYKNATGQYYLSKDWKKCRVITKENKDYIFNTCNYNIFDKRFEYIIDNTTFFLKKEQISSVFINKMKFEPSIFNNENNYYRLIYKFNETFKLIELYKLKKKSIPSSSSLGLYVNKVEKKSKKFILKDGELIELPKSKKKTLRLLNKKYDKKKHKDLKISKEEDLINLIKS